MAAVPQGDQPVLLREVRDLVSAAKQRARPTAQP